jgi:hypothetical protein
MLGMATRDGNVARATRVAAEDEHRVLAELGRAQRTAGLSDEAIGRACGLTRWTVARIVQGRRTASVVELAAIGAAVGRDVRLQVFLAGDAIRDAGQQRLLARLRVRIDASVGMQLEVPLADDRDRRAWDAMLFTAAWRRPVEAETVIDDVQAAERKLRLKMRDGGEDGVLLVVADTRRNRRALQSATLAFAGFSRDARATLVALRRGECPPTSAIVFL